MGMYDDILGGNQSSGGAYDDILNDAEPKKQDSALTRGITQANSARKTFGALATGDYDAAAKLATERDAYQRANPGTPEGNQLMSAWEKGDGIIGGIKGVAGEFAKDWREAPSGISALQATGKNLSAMGGGIVEQIPNMVMPMAGMLAGGAAGSLAGPVGTVGGAFAGAATGNTAAESAEQVDRAIRGAGINPQDTGAVRSFLEQDAGGILGKSAIKGGIIGAVDTATMGIGGKMLRAPVNAATDRAIAAMGIDAADKAAVAAVRKEIGERVLADPIYQASQKGAQALTRNVGVAALEPVGEFAGEYLGQGAATGDWDTKGAMLEALSSLGQSGITYAGQKIYQAATSPLRGVKADQTAPQDAPTIPPDVSLTSDPVPVQQRIDTMLGLDATRMDDKGRKQYEADLVAAFNEPIGIRLDANQNEVPYTMGEYLDSQIKIADNERAKPLRSGANQQAATRLNQLADEEAQQHAAITQDLVQSAAQGGALSKAALTGIQTGATQMPVHPERAAIEQQMLADEAAQAELAPTERLMRTRSDEQVQRIAENENANPKMRQVAIADLQRRMETKAHPTTTSPLPQTATQFNLPENSRAAQPVQMAQEAQETNAPQDGIEQGAAPQARIKRLQAQLENTEPFTEQSSALTDALQSAVSDDAKVSLSAGEMPVYKVTDHVSVAIHPSAQNPGMVQVTRYTKDGVIGDSQYNNVDDAVRQEGLTHKPRIASNDAVAVIEKSIQAEAEYQQRKNAAPVPNADAGIGVAGITRKRSIENWTADELQARLNRADTGESPLQPESRQKIEAELAKRPARKAPINHGLSVGAAPNATQPISVRNGVIFIGDEPAVNYDTEQDITIANDATPRQIVDALKAGGAIASSQKFYGLPAEPKAAKQKVDRRQIDATKDTLFEAIAKLGGMDTHELTSNGFDQKDIGVRHNGRVIQSGKNKGQLTKPSFKSLSLGFNMPLHKKGGMSFDGVLEELKQHGYFPEDATKNDAIEAFRRELGGDAVMTPDAAMQQAEMQAEQEENDAIGYDDLSDREKALVDFHAENIYDEDSPIEAFKRGMKRDGATEDEINEAIKQTFGTQETGNNDSGGSAQGTGETRDAQGAWNGSQDGQVQESAEPDWLTGQTNEQAAAELAKRKADIAEEKRQHEELIAKAKRESNAKEKARRAAQVLAEREAAKKAEVDKAAEDFALGQAAPAPVDRKVTTEDARGQQDVFAQPVRGEVGASLTKAERSATLKTLIDVYRQNRAPKEFKGLDANGNERYGYAHSPEFFVKSDITGSMVRYYVTLPDGRVAHPTELFSDYTQANIDAALQKEIDAEREQERNNNSERERLLSLTAPTINEANGKFNNAQRFAEDRDSIVPALLTNGELYLRSRPENADKAASLLGEGWRVEAQPVKATTEAKAVEPWQMTRLLFKEHRRVWDESNALLREIGKAEKPSPYKIGSSREAMERGRVAGVDYRLGDPTHANGGFEHHVLVAEAVKDGKPVPANVLADYPDLKPKAVEPAAVNAKKEAETDDGIRYSKASNKSWYYSQLAKAIEQAPDRVFTTGTQVKLWLAGNKSKVGIKDDEIQWTGINDFLDMQGKAKVSKADVLAYLDGNGVQVQEVVKGASEKPQWRKNQLYSASGEYIGTIEDAGDSFGFVFADDSYFDTGKSNMDSAIKAIESRVGEIEKDTEKTKYASYQLPGGTNYRELLLTLPANKQQSGWAVEENADGSYVIRKPDGKLYVGSDSGEVLTWATERGAQGAMEGYAKQSDKNNYRSSHWDERNILAHIRMNDRVDADGRRVLFIEEVQSDWQQAKRGGKDVPDAPFVGTSDPKPSVALAIKRITAYAAENGYDKVAFINGEQSADRYDLSKQIARVEVSRPQDGSFAFYAYKNKTDTVPVVQNRVQTAQELADHLGKDFAEKAAKQPVGTKRDYTGLDLKVGGEGMKAFYDQIVPQVLSDVLKKVGGKVGGVNIGGSKAWNPETDSEVTDADMIQPGFVVTPEMREKVAGGLPLFSRNNAAQGQSFPRSQAESRIKSILGDKLGKVLIDSGIVTFTNKGSEYQGATYKDGSIALNLDALNADNFAGVLQHEGFHSTIRDLVGEQTYTQMMKRLDTMQAMGKGAQWVKDANAAIPSNTKAEHRTEELAAYAIEQYVNGAKQPNIITRWVESLLSALRTAIIRRLPFGKLKSWAVNNLQPQDLANLAIAGLKAKAQGQVQAQGREAMAFSQNKNGANVSRMADKDTVAGTQAPTSAGDGSTGSAKEINGIPVLNLSIPEYLADPQKLIDDLASSFGDSGQAIGIRGIYEDELGVADIANSHDNRDGADNSELEGVSTIGITGDWSYDPDQVLKNFPRFASGALKFGDTPYIAVIEGRPSIDDIANDPGEYVMRDAKTIAYIKRKPNEPSASAGSDVQFSKINQTDTPAFKNVDVDRTWRDLIGRNKFSDFDTDPEFTVTRNDDEAIGAGVKATPREFTLSKKYGGQWVALNVAEQTTDNDETVFSSSLEASADYPAKTGIATRMYLSALNVAQKRGIGWMSEGVRSDNALAMYDRLRTAGIPFVEDGRASYISAEELAKVDLQSVADRLLGKQRSQADIRYSRASSQTANKSDIGRIVGDSGRDYDQRQRQFFKNVGRDVSPKNLIERTRDYLQNDFWKKMAVGIVDQFRGLRDLNDNGQAYMLARLSKGTAGAFETLLHHGKLSLKDGVYDGDTSGGFVDKLGVPLHGELDDFLWYVAANRAEGLSKVDRENLFTQEDIAAGKSLAKGATAFDYTIQTGPGKGTVTRNRAMIYADALRVFNGFQRNALDIAEQSGLIDGASRKFWESEFYVPFYRVSEEDGEFVGAKMGNALVRQQAFKKLKGGTDKLNSDLLSNTLLNWSHLIEASAKNRAAKASLEAAEKTGAAHKARPGEKNTVWYMGEVTKTIPAGKKYFEDGQEKVSDGTAQIAYIDKIEYGVDDPFVLTAITSLEYAGMRNGIMDVMTKFKHLLTIGVTASPAFKVRNLIRDSIQSIGTSELSYNPIKNVAEGFKQTKRDSQEYVSALASGGLIRFGTMLEGSESSRVRQLIKSGVKDSSILNNEPKWRQFYDKYLEPGIAAYNELGNRSEEINRAALYNQLVKQGKSHAEAALLARDLMDFSMQGSFNTIRFLTQVVPFMNARLQGMYKLGRSAKDNPRKLAAVTGAVAMASIALMLANEDDDDWKRREDWDRDSFWWFKFGGLEYRIPKPFEVGAIGTLAERSLELMLNDEMDGERFRKVVGSLVMNNLSMNPIPQAVKPMLDLYSNKDSFTGRPIESMSMQRLEPTMRFNSNTSMVARGLSNATLGALSPVQYDHLARAYFGWLGAFAVGGADLAARAVSDEPTKPALDYWRFATQGIVREAGTGSSRYVTQVYEQAKELERAHATFNQLRKDGKLDEAKEYMADHADELQRYKVVEKVKQAESKLNERIRNIERSDIDADEKKLRIEAINRMKESVAKRVSPGYGP